MGGIISFQVLPRPQFSALQTKIFPVYFSIQTTIPVILALTYPGATSAFGSAGAAGIAGVLDPDNRWSVLAPIAAIFLTGLANLAVVGPATTKCMKERKHQGKFASNDFLPCILNERVAGLVAGSLL